MWSPLMSRLADSKTLQRHTLHKSQTMWRRTSWAVLMGEKREKGKPRSWRLLLFFTRSLLSLRYESRRQGSLNNDLIYCNVKLLYGYKQNILAFSEKALVLLAHADFNNYVIWIVSPLLMFNLSYEILFNN